MRLVRGVVAVALSAWYLSYVFQISGGRLPEDGLADWLDPYFINFLLEHWYHSLRSLTDPSSPSMYFPVKGTLGYSHGLILYVPFYAAVRPFLDLFQSYSLALLLVFEFGALCLYAIFRRFMRLGFVESLLFVAFFLTSANIVNRGTAIWSQTASVFLVPPILLIGLTAARMPAGRIRLLLAFFAGLLAALLFVQDFYTGAFALLLAGLLLAGVLVLERQRVEAFGETVWGLVEPHWVNATVPRGAAPRPSRWWVAASCLLLIWAAVVSLHPIDRMVLSGWHVSARNPTRPLHLGLLAGAWFLIRRLDLIGRLVRMARRFSRTAVAAIPDLRRTLAASARAADVRKNYASYVLAIALGGLAGSLVFFWIYLGAYGEHHTFPQGQVLDALTDLDSSKWHGPMDVIDNVAAYESSRPFALVLIIGVLIRVSRFQVDVNSRRYSLWFLAISLIVFLLPLKFHGWSLWGLLFAPLPGLSILRDPTRIIYTYELGVVLVVGLLVGRLPGKSLPRIAVASLFVVLLASDWNTRVFPFERPRHFYREWVEAPIDINPSCRSFFIKGASDTYMSRAGHMWSLYGMDAALISLNHGIPTLNGYSAWAPVDWHLANPQTPEYIPAVRQWIDRYHLRGVCALDIDQRTMTPFE